MAVALIGSMRTASNFVYVLLLLTAFAVGLLGTLAVSRALVSLPMNPTGAPRTQPVHAPQPTAPAAATTEC